MGYGNKRYKFSRDKLSMADVQKKNAERRLKLQIEEADKREMVRGDIEKCGIARVIKDDNGKEIKVPLDRINMPNRANQKKILENLLRKSGELVESRDKQIIEQAKKAQPEQVDINEFDVEEKIAKAKSFLREIGLKDLDPSEEDKLANAVVKSNINTEALKELVYRANGGVVVNTEFDKDQLLFDAEVSDDVKKQAIAAFNKKIDDEQNLVGTGCYADLKSLIEEETEQDELMKEQLREDRIKGRCNISRVEDVDGEVIGIPLSEIDEPNRDRRNKFINDAKIKSLVDVLKNNSFIEKTKDEKIIEQAKNCVEKVDLLEFEKIINGAEAVLVGKEEHDTLESKCGIRPAPRRKEDHTEVLPSQMDTDKSQEQRIAANCIKIPTIQTDSDEKRMQRINEKIKYESIKDTIDNVLNEPSLIEPQDLKPCEDLIQSKEYKATVSSNLEKSIATVSDEIVKVKEKLKSLRAVLYALTTSYSKLNETTKA